MCDDVDNQEKSDSSDYETDEEWEIERKKQQAAMEKDAVSYLYVQYSCSDSNWDGIRLP